MPYRLKPKRGWMAIAIATAVVLLGLLIWKYRPGKGEIRPVATDSVVALTESPAEPPPPASETAPVSSPTENSSQQRLGVLEEQLRSLEGKVANQGSALSRIQSSGGRSAGAITMILGVGALFIAIGAWYQAKRTQVTFSGEDSRANAARREINELRSEFPRLKDVRRAQEEELRRIRDELGNIVGRLAKLESRRQELVGGVPVSRQEQDPIAYPFGTEADVGPPRDLRPISASPRRAAGIAVDVDDFGRLLEASSLTPTAFVSVEGGGRARVELNPAKYIENAELQRLGKLFEFPDVAATATMYETVEPALVTYDGVTFGSTPLQRGRVRPARRL